LRISNFNGKQTEEEMVQSFFSHYFDGRRTWRSIVGESPALIDALDEACLGDYDGEIILIVGATGVGKGLLAREIHAGSRRKSKKFLSVNCGAIPEPLIESALFGHTMGAFTDAKMNKKGLFVAAEGGTLFLDELSELPPEMQVKLLNVLDDREVLPVGSTNPVKIDCRIVAAVMEDIDNRVADGRFRLDLYHRLSVIRTDLPRLRERREDIPLLVAYFLGGSGVVFSERVMNIFMNYAWPGNVRELENAVRRGRIWARHHRVSVIPQKCFKYGPLSKIAEDGVGVGDYAEIVKLLADQFCVPGADLNIKDLTLALYREMDGRCRRDSKKAGDIIGVTAKTIRNSRPTEE